MDTRAKLCFLFLSSRGINQAKAIGLQLVEAALPLLPNSISPSPITLSLYDLTPPSLCPGTARWTPPSVHVHADAELGSV
jgi:hypothetical protein